MTISQHGKMENCFTQHKRFVIIPVLVVLILVLVIFKIVSGSNNAAPSGTLASVDQSQSRAEQAQSSSELPQSSPQSAEPTIAPTRASVLDETAESGESTEYEKALKAAQSYSDLLHMSKKTIYDQLTSDNMDHFSPESAQYAVDNVQADFKQNALLSAQSYRDMVDMSSTDIFNQLTSSTDQFTPEEAQYAIDNLDK